MYTNIYNEKYKENIYRKRKKIRICENDEFQLALELEDRERWHLTDAHRKPIAKTGPHTWDEMSQACFFFERGTASLVASEEERS